MVDYRPYFAKCRYFLRFYNQYFAKKETVPTPQMEELLADFFLEGIEYAETEGTKRTDKECYNQIANRLRNTFSDVMLELTHSVCQSQDERRAFNHFSSVYFSELEKRFEQELRTPAK